MNPTFTPAPVPAKTPQSQNKPAPVPQRNAARRFIAKVANFGFRNARWEAGDIVEVSPEEAAIIPHHFDPLGPAEDGSDDPAMKEALQKDEKLSHLKDIKVKKTYDRVQPVLPGGPAVAVAKTPEQVRQESVDRKNEEKANDARREKARTQPLPASATPVVAAPVRPGLVDGQPSGRPVTAETPKPK